MTGDDNVAGGGTQGTLLKRIGADDSECSFCPPPGMACLPRWFETPGKSGSSWAQFHVNFYRNDTTPTGAAPANPTNAVHLTKYFYGMVEYLGWAQCNFTDMDPTVTNLDAYDTAQVSAAGRTRGCRLLRVTVRNQPPKVSLPTITLQSTLLVASALNYPAGTYSKDTPGCCAIVDPLKPASTISRNQSTSFSGAIDAERISWRQIYTDAY